MSQPKEDKKAKQIQAILDQARQLFARDGFVQVSMDRLAKACGMTKPALYYYFKDKHAILEVLLVEHEENCMMSKQYSYQVGSLREFLQTIVRNFDEEYRLEKNLELFRIIFSLSLSSDHEAQKIYREQHIRMIKRIEKFFTDFCPVNVPKNVYRTALVLFFGPLFAHSFHSKILRMSLDPEMDETLYYNQLIETTINYLENYSTKSKGEHQ